MATRAEVDRTLRELVRRLDGADLDSSSLPPDRTLALVVTDLGVTYRGELKKGKIRKFSPDASGSDADVSISVGSEDLIALAEGRSSVAMALLSGRLRVDAGARDLLLLRQLF